MESFSLKEFSLLVRLRVVAERMWLRAGLTNVQRVLVQTPTMQRIVMNCLRVRADILPFKRLANPISRQAEPCVRRERRFDFLYVSSGEPHKNHVRLIEAWQMLAQEGIRPRLCVTLSPERNIELCRHIDDASARHGLNNIGAVPAEQIQDLYAATWAFIYPSLVESFGLSLLEAAAAKLPIVASELDYVRDVVDPVQTFDRTSPISIARAVRRQLCAPDEKVMPTDAEAFLRRVMDKGLSDMQPISRQSMALT